ncbi:ABC transporter substrate-binding protein [Agrococcus sp. ProA11]|uniref:ABC transporter substrate-binding protein n=1 Tax=Agrococcus chionoecetis TaxID=3153752 RepID=UPI00326198C4
MARSPIRTTAVLAAVALALTGCAAGSTPSGSEAPSDGGTDVLAVAASAAVTTWDPIASFSTEALYMGNLYETLLQRNPVGSDDDYTNLLAESYETSDDGLSWTFTLREGVSFHDGEPLNADAVVQSVEAAKERGGASFIWAPVESVEATDERTVVFTLAYAAPLDLIVASTYGAWIVSPAALDAVSADETYFEAGIEAGTGPYTLRDYAPGERVVLEAFDGYWNADAASHYEIVDVSITPDAVTAQQMLTSGEVQFATTLPLENVDQVAEQIDAEVRATPSPFSFLAYFNTTREPLNDPLVRQALSYAIPYQDLIDVGAHGYGTQSFGPVPQGIFPFSEDVDQYTYDLDRARELLAEAGNADGFSLSLTYASENAAEARFVPLIADSFAQIGVELEVRGELFTQQWEAAKADPASAQDIFVVYYWPTYSDAGSDNLYSLFHSSDEPFFNLSYWSNAEYDALVDEAGTLTGTDRDAAQAMYVDAMQLLVDQAPGAFLYDAQVVTVVPADLQVAPFNENYPFTTFFANIRPTE